MCVRERIPLGALLKILLLFVVFPVSSSPQRATWVKTVLVIYLVGVDCIGYVSYSTYLVGVDCFGYVSYCTRRRVLIGRDGSIMLTPIHKPTLTRGRCAYIIIKIWSLFHSFQTNTKMELPDTTKARS